MPENPQYRLEGSGGQLLGALYINSDGDIVLENSSTGTELTMGSEGVRTPPIESEASSGEVNAGEFESYDAARQYALDNNFGTVYVPSGTYNEPCEVPEGLKVYGDGYATHFSPDGNGGSVGADATLQQVRLSSGTGSIDDAIDPVEDGAVIKDVVISHAQRNGILVRSSGDTYITGVRFEGQIGSTGVQYFSSSENNIINHCWISGGIQNDGNNVVGNEIIHI